MRVRAIVPVKPLNRAKSRLSPVLSPAQREALSRFLLEHTLRVLQHAPSIQEVFVVTRDTAAIALARDHGVNTLQESSDSDLIAGLTFATQVAAHAGANAVLLVASDIPFLQPDDLEAMITMAKNSTKPQHIIIAPDRQQDGTNAMLVTPPGAIQYRFGADSYSKHIEEAKKTNTRVSVYESKTISLDIDYPEDLELYKALLEDGNFADGADIRTLPEANLVDVAS